jgi:hypothetical protein
MIDLRERTTTPSPLEVRAWLAEALNEGDRERARRLFYTHVLPGRGFPSWEIEHLAERVGAIDEGDSYLAERTDL